MKKYLILLLAGGLSASVISCGGSEQKEDETKKPENPLEAIQEAANNMQSGTEDAQKKMEERKKKGDTLAMKYEDLMKYLPDEISGYTKGEPTGTTVSMMGQSYSNAEVKYANGDNWVKVQIIDYNQAYSLYSSAAMMWTMGFSVDSPEEKAGSVKLQDNVAGWEVFKKKNKDAELTLGVGYRFWIHVKANKQENTDFIKGVAKDMDLSTLANM